MKVPEEVPAQPQKTYLTDGRIDVLKWLERNDAVPIASMYEAAIAMLLDVSFPGRIHLIGHAVREIRNRLPEVIVGKDIVEARLDYKKEVDGIVALWETENLPLDGYLPISDVNTVPADPSSQGVVISGGIFKQMGMLITKHKRVPLKNKEKARLLYEFCIKENGEVQSSFAIIVEQWWKVTEWFMDRTHLSLKGAIYEEQDLLKNFEIFEASLRGLSRGFFDVLKEIDEILEVANS